MANDIIINVDNVTLEYNLAKERIDTLKEYFIKYIKGQLRYNKFIALQDVSFSIKRGESFGIIGLNGSGKSSLLKLIARVMPVTSGKITVNGSIVPLLELGAGFDYDMTAHENIYLNGALLGHSKSFVKSKIDEIVDFSGLYEFLDVPLKNFSSGMISRLGFAIATIVKPEILIIDEVLSVGDFDFQQKCQKKIEELCYGGTTLLFVSHSAPQVIELCAKALWLDKGLLRMVGDSKQVCDAYSKKAPQDTHD